MLAKLLYLILVAFYCNSLIIVNQAGIVCTDDILIPLLNVNFLHVRNDTE